MAIAMFLGRIRKALRRRLAIRKNNRPSCESLEGRQLLASSILFNPTGTPGATPIAIGGFDEAPGNALARGSLPLTVGRTFQLDYQATLAGLINPNGGNISPPGLNTSYQLTVVASFTEVVTDSNPAAGTATFALAPTQSANSFFEVYYNPAVVVDNLAGTGFTAGTRILSGKVASDQTNSGNFALALDANNAPFITSFDQFGADDYPGQLTVTGAGSARINSEVTSYDPAFFTGGVIGVGFNTNTTVPYTTTNPAKQFVGGPGGSATPITPNLGAVNGASGPDFQFLADANNSFTPIAPSIAVTKATNGVVAPTATGPIVGVGSTVTWTYDITNPGNEPLKNVTIVDDNGTPSNPADDFTPTFVSGDANGNGLLDPGEDFKYTATSTALAGQYENRVATTGLGNVSSTPVNAGSISHYFATAPVIAVAKATNGVIAPTATGPVVGVGSTVTWTYDVTNPGNEPLKNVTIVDDNGTPSNPADDFTPTFVSGDANGNGLLDPGEDFRYTATGIARVGQYENRAAVNGLGNLDNTPVNAATISHYFAAAPAIAVAKATNGVIAPTATGPVVGVGSTVTWTYDVTNPGNEPLANVSIVDDNGTPSNPLDNFAPTFVGGDTNGNGLLDPGEDFRYTATGTALAGQYENRVATTGTGTLSNVPVGAGSISHYFGSGPSIAITKLTNGSEAISSRGPVVFVNSPVTWTYIVTNTGNVPLTNLDLVDNNGTPNNPADDFRPTLVAGQPSLATPLAPGESRTFLATGVAGSGQYTNTAIVAGQAPTGSPVNAITNSNYFGICPTVVAVQRLGVHLQPTQVVVTFNGPLDPSMAQDTSNYRLFSIGKDGKFDVPDPVVSAVYNPSNNTVTLTAANRLNVHHLSELQVTNPCPGGPNFDGILNRKFSLGAVTIIGKRGHHFVFPATGAPTVLNPAILPTRLVPANRAAVNRASLLPASSAFSTTTPVVIKATAKGKIPYAKTRIA